MAKRTHRVERIRPGQDQQRRLQLADEAAAHAEDEVAAREHLVLEPDEVLLRERPVEAVPVPRGLAVQAVPGLLLARALREADLQRLSDSKTFRGLVIRNLGEILFNVVFVLECDRPAAASAPRENAPAPPGRGRLCHFL
jgi:hypothetical protein